METDRPSKANVKAEATYTSRFVEYVGFSKGGGYDIDAYYKEMKLNSTYAVIVNACGLWCCMVSTELQTNKWFLDENEHTLPEYDGYVLMCKFVSFLFTIWLILMNIRYHVLKLGLQLHRANVSEEKRVSIWQVRARVGVCMCALSASCGVCSTAVCEGGSCLTRQLCSL